MLDRSPVIKRRRRYRMRKPIVRIMRRATLHSRFTTSTPVVAVTTYSVERFDRACAALRLARKRLQKRISMREQRAREQEFKADPVRCYSVYLSDTVAATFADDVGVPEGVDKNLLMLDDREFRALIGDAVSRATTKAALPKLLCGAPRQFDPKRSKVRKLKGTA